MATINKIEFNKEFICFKTQTFILFNLIQEIHFLVTLAVNAIIDISNDSRASDAMCKSKQIWYVLKTFWRILKMKT